MSAGPERGRSGRTANPQPVFPPDARARPEGGRRLPGPFRPEAWTSPLRGPWLTSVLGLVLLVGLSAVALTGFASYAAYNPRLGDNDLTPGAGWLRFYLFDWPVSPPWLYRLNQGVHVTVGIAMVPVVLAKLWSVAPRLYKWPPLRSPAQALERLNLALLIGGAVFQLATGLLNIQYAYLWGFSFYEAHLYGAWVFTASFAAHAAIKFPTMVRSLRRRPAPGAPEAPDPDELAPAAPGPPTLSRRALLTLTGGASALLVALTAGQSLGGRWRRLALLAPRGRDRGDGPQDFPVNKTARSAGVTADDVGAGWRLELVGRRTVALSLPDLQAMDQGDEELPIACVEGWSTMQRWQGVRLRDLAELVDRTAAAGVLVESLQEGGSFSTATLSGDQLRARRSLLALQVNGVPLSLDHGFPARVIVPAAPGVRNTKWVRRLTFAEADG